MSDHGNNKPQIIITGGNNEIDLAGLFKSANGQPFDIRIEGGTNKINFNGPQEQTMLTNEGTTKQVEEQPQEQIEQSSSTNALITDEKTAGDQDNQDNKDKPEETSNDKGAKTEGTSAIANAGTGKSLMPLPSEEEKNKDEEEKNKDTDKQQPEAGKPVAQHTPQHDSKAPETNTRNAKRHRWINTALAGGALLVALFARQCSNNNDAPVVVTPDPDENKTEITVPELETINVDVLFEHDSYELTEAGKIELNKLGRRMEYLGWSEIPADLEICGNASTPGTEAYNLDLGQKRADAVKNYLEKHFKIAYVDIETGSNGEEYATGNHKQDRHVELEVTHNSF